MLDCPTCGCGPGEPGYLRLDAPVGHPDFGRIVPCPACFKAKKHLRARKLPLEGWLAGASFENYRVTSDNEPAFTAAKEFAESPTGFLTLWSEYGRGKTHLMAATYNHLLKAGVPVLFASMPDLVSELRSEIGGGDPEAFYQYTSRFQVLILDDVDWADFRNWTREQVFRFFNRRYNLFQQTGTMLAFNKNPHKSNAELGFLFSRINDDRNRCVFVGGDDNRPKASLLQKLGQLRRKYTGGKDENR